MQYTPLMPAIPDLIRDGISDVSGGSVIGLQPGPGVEAREVAPGKVADLDAAGRVVGLDIDHASKHLDLSKVETVDLPIEPAEAE